jgi:hypothetical protein
MQRDSISRDHLTSYLEKTRRAMTKARQSPPPRSHLKTVAEDFFKMAKAYREDAEHFFNEGDLVNAFACVNYAHGWLDAGARLGLFDVDGDNELFTLSE